MCVFAKYWVVVGDGSGGGDGDGGVVCFDAGECR